MRLFNFIIWLTTGALIGWFASRMVTAEDNRLHKVELDLVDSE